MTGSRTLTRSRLLVIVATLFLVPGGAHAQNFFERLFGITPQPAPRQGPPPAYPYNNAPPPVPGDLSPGGDEVRRAPAAPVQARPVSIKAPSEESVVGRDLKLNGINGSLRLDRQGSDMKLRLTLIGRRAPQSVETCNVPIGGADGLPLVSLGRPEGTPRYQAQDPACPMQIDIVDEAVIVKGPADVCVFQALGCQADPSGMWGPDPSQIVARAKDYESGRASADKAVRENYKVLTQRAKPDAVRAVVAEQAAFSADREMMCKSYAREGTTSFCNSKYSEARALALGSRLGIGTTASTQSAETRPRRSRAAPDPYALPSSDELLQRRRADDD